MYFFTVFDVSGVLIIARVSGSGNFLTTAHAVGASETLYRIGLVCGLIGTLSTILLAAGLYVALRPFDGNLAMTALLFRLAESAIGGVVIVFGFLTLQIYLEAGRVGAPGASRLSELGGLVSGASVVGTNVSVVFFGVGSTLFFYLLLRSAYIPRVLAMWGLIGSIVCFIAFLASLVIPQSTELLTGIGGLPVGLAEPVVGAWLLIRGIGGRTPPSSGSRGIDQLHRSAPIAHRDEGGIH
jgi:hypothetical protein